MSGRRVKGCTGSRTRSAGRSPSTERVRMQAKRTLDAAGTPKAYRQGGGQGQRPPYLPPQPVGQEPTREALKPKRFQVKPEGREGGRQQTDEACSEHGRRPLLFLPNLAAVAHRCGLFLAWAVELRPGDHPAPSGGLDKGEGGPAKPGEPRRGAPCPVPLRELFHSERGPITG